MPGLTTLGLFHTVISLIALVCGIWALFRDREISPRNALGEFYLVGTFLSAATGLFIFQRGGFGPPHVFSVLTLVALAVGTIAATSGLFGAWSRYIQAIAYSTTIFFHLVPGIVETTTRLPREAPLVASPDAPELQVVVLVLLVLLVIGLVLQLRWLRGAMRQGSRLRSATR
jgi:uncharacterized membrane protein